MPSVRTAVIATLVACAAPTLPAQATNSFQPNSTFLGSRPSGFGTLPDDGAADSGATSERLSADGRYLAFSSRSDGLSSEDDNLRENVFVRDLQTNTTTLVSR